jgi:hypothetical protein
VDIPLVWYNYISNFRAKYQGQYGLNASLICNGRRMSVASSVSSTNGDIPLTAEDQQEFQNLPTLLTQWKKVQEEKNKLVQQKKAISQQIREQDKRCSVMEAMIMGTMKKHSIGALDLKSSNARALYKKRAVKAPIGKKEMKKHLTEHLKSEEAAKKLLDFLSEKREVKVTEALVYEKNELS